MKNQGKWNHKKKSQGIAQKHEALRWRHFLKAEQKNFTCEISLNIHVISKNGARELEMWAIKEKKTLV